MSSRIQAVRGMNDITPQETAEWRRLEHIIRHIMDLYQIREIRMPIVEKTQVFTHSIGQGTDVVEKEMYSFNDRNGDSLSLRPEGTAGCVRAVIQNNLLQTNLLRVWYLGPMFRYERPQKGRTRQFHQTGVEIFGQSGPDADVELILISQQLWKALSISDLVLEINTLGNAESRTRYRENLIAYFENNIEKLDEDARKRLHTNPLRILDSKNSDMTDLINQAPVIQDSLDEASLQHFNTVCDMLDQVGMPYKKNSRLVRGLDYYNHTVFEWTTDKLGAQSAVCAGGRYDGLFERLGGKATPATGFALGMERLMELIKLQTPQEDNKPDAFLVTTGLAADLSPVMAAKIREAYPDLKLETNLGGGSFKAQFKRADKSDAAVALVIGDNEMEQNQVTVKALRQDLEQFTINLQDLMQNIKPLI